MSKPSVIKNVAIVGATGHVGEHFVAELLKTGKHQITAIVRNASKGKVPDGVHVARVDYDDEASLIAAMKGQDFLIITLGATAPPGTHKKLVGAAVQAGIRWIMPNSYGIDYTRPEIADTFSASMVRGNVRDVAEAGASSIGVVCGFWYEWSLACGEAAYGFSIAERKATFFDDGATVIATSTWENCGRAVAALLSLPVEGASPALADWRDTDLCISSFRVSQRDMLDSLHRVLGTTDAGWEIRYESAAKRVADGQAEMARGERSGFAKMLYSRMFFKDGVGNHETGRTMANGALGLPEEDIDGATRRAVQMVESGWTPFG